MGAARSKPDEAAGAPEATGAPAAPRPGPGAAGAPPDAPSPDSPPAEPHGDLPEEELSSGEAPGRSSSRRPSHVLGFLLPQVRWQLRCASDPLGRALLSSPDTDLPDLHQALRRATAELCAGERQRDSSYIGAFRERTMFEGFAEVLQADASPVPLKLEVLKGISALIEQIQLQPSMDYLIDKCLNPIFELPPSLSDDDLVAGFVSILRQLALKLNHANVQALLVPVSESGTAGSSPAVSGASGSSARMHMPMFACAVGFVAHREAMVQIAARIAVLSVLSLDCQSARDAVQETVGRDLAPLVVRISRCPEELRELVKAKGGKCKWSSTRLWSRRMTPAEAVVDLRAHGDIPVVLLCVHSGKKVCFERIADAAAALEDAMHQDRDDFNGFVLDLLNLNIPDVNECLHGAGLDPGFRDALGDVSALTVHMQRREEESLSRLGGVAFVGALAGGVTLGMIGAPITGAVTVAGAVGLAAGGGAALSEAASRGREVREARGGPPTEGYRLGDVTRGLVARGKETRGADANDAYSIGDFARGLSASLGGGARAAPADPPR